jgi:hypothetical protein
MCSTNSVLSILARHSRHRTNPGTHERKKIAGPFDFSKRPAPIPDNYGIVIVTVPTV